MYRQYNGGNIQQNSSSKRGWITVLLCVIMFVIGWRWQPSTQPPVQLTTTTKTREPRALVETNVVDDLATQQQQPQHTNAPAPPRYSGAEEAIVNAGLLRERPVIQPGSTGVHDYLVQPVQQLSIYPRAYHWPRFLSEASAEHLRQLAEGHMRPSQLVLNDGDSQDNYKGVRTSEGAFFSREQDPVFAMVEDKIAALTGVPTHHGEAFNVLRYETGQHYDQHYDYMPEDMYGPIKNNRLATILVYLKAPEEGGETIFPLEGPDGLARLDQGLIDYKHCNLGLKYKPRTGDALLFYSMYPNGTFDRHSLHGGCAVVKGTKWVMTKWLRIDSLSADDPL